MSKTISASLVSHNENLAWGLSRLDVYDLSKSSHCVLYLGWSK